MGVVLSASAHRSVLDRARLDASLSQPHKDFKVDIPALAASLHARGLEHDESSLGVRLSKSGPFMAVVRQVEPIVAVKVSTSTSAATTAMLHPDNVQVAPLFLSDLAWCNGSAILDCVLESIRAPGPDADLERKMAALVAEERKIPYYRTGRRSVASSLLVHPDCDQARPIRVILFLGQTGAVSIVLDHQACAEADDAFFRWGEGWCASAVASAIDQV